MSYWNGSRWVAEPVAPATPRRRPHRLLGAAAEAGLITLLMFGLIAGTAFAAKGGQRGSSGASISFDTAGDVTVGTSYTVVGSGFRADTWVTVGAHYPDTTWWASGKTDASGSIRLVLTASSAGEILHEAKEVTNSGRLRLMDTATLSVAP